jgi:hypothetical protein
MNDTTKKNHSNKKNSNSQKRNGPHKKFRRNNNNNNKRRSSGNKNRRPKALTPSRILQKYDNLLEQYLVARRKFFDLFGRGKQKQITKAQNNYQHTLKSLRSFEEGLKDWQKDVLANKIDGYPEDRQYSREHKLEPKGDEVSFVGEFPDPHLLPGQKATDWSKDTEESEGTIEDYNKYKGLA